MGEQCVLRDWVVREDLNAAVVSYGSAGIPILHSIDSGCAVTPVHDQEHDRAWVAASRRDEIAHFEATGERVLYFCEMCVVRRIDSPVREHPTGGNALCPKCYLHHAGDCV